MKFKFKVEINYQKEDGTRLGFLLNEDLIYCQSLRILSASVQEQLVLDQIDKDFLHFYTTMIAALHP